MCFTLIEFEVIIKAMFTSVHHRIWSDNENSTEVKYIESWIHSGVLGSLCGFHKIILIYTYICITYMYADVYI